jgi:hypothetical protein
MTAKQAIDKIVDVLNLKFKAFNFAKTELVDGTVVTNNMDDEFRVGQELFVELEDSVLQPAPQGQHETREGLIITVSETGIIQSIAQKTEELATEGEVEDDIEREETKDEMAEVEISDVRPEMVDLLIEALKPIMEEMASMKEEMKKMNDKFNKETDSIKTDFDKFKKSPERKSVVEKPAVKEQFMDYKLELIKSIRNK